MAKNLIPWDLILSHLKGTECAKEKEAFRQWIHCAENAALYTEVESLWKEIQQKVSSYSPDVDSYWKKMEAEINHRHTKNVFHKFLRPIAVAASVLLFIATGTVAYLAGKSSSTIQYATQQFSTTTAKSNVVLPDGTTVLLNRESMLSYNMDDGNRNVQLVGEGFFVVAKDEKHPFIVRTKELGVKVYGTKFNVRSYAFNKETRVSLVEGHISLLRDNDEIHMKKGQLAVMDKKTRKIKIGMMDEEMDTLWKQKSISFKNQSLAEICTYLERWYDVQIHLDPRISKFTYTFTVTDEPIEVILQNMSLIHSIKYDVDDKEITIDKGGK